MPHFTVIRGSFRKFLEEGGNDKVAQNREGQKIDLDNNKLLIRFDISGGGKQVLRGANASKSVVYQENLRHIMSTEATEKPKSLNSYRIFIVADISTNAITANTVVYHNSCHII